MESLQRVNLLLERRQREALQRVARREGRSVSDLVRAYITLGLNEGNNRQDERIHALENARALKQHILDRRGGKPLTDAGVILDRIREKRTHELLGG
jgi:hypothetical protein